MGSLTALDVPNDYLSPARSREQRPVGVKADRLGVRVRLMAGERSVLFPCRRVPNLERPAFDADCQETVVGSEGNRIDRLSGIDDAHFRSLADIPDDDSVVPRGGEARSSRVPTD